MAHMTKALKLIFSGEKTLEKHICLFSICGIASIVTAFFSLNYNNLIEISTINKILLNIIFCIFNCFFISFEVYFLNTKKLPNIDLNIIKLMGNKLVLLIALLTLPIIILTSMGAVYPALYIETIISIPLTMIIAGFAINFNYSEKFNIFKKFRVKDYFMLLIKRIWIIILAYFINFIICTIIFTLGLIAYVILYHVDIQTLIYTLFGHNPILEKLAIFIYSLIGTYVATILVLLWDYELLKTYERD